jgi:hypothetical protein
MRRRARTKTLGKKLKIVIGVVIGTIIVAFMAVPIVQSFVSPGTVLEADPDNITGVKQFLVLKMAAFTTLSISGIHIDHQALPACQRVFTFS